MAFLPLRPPSITLPVPYKVGTTALHSGNCAGRFCHGTGFVLRSVTALPGLCSSSYLTVPHPSSALVVRPYGSPQWCPAAFMEIVFPLESGY